MLSKRLLRMIVLNDVELDPGLVGFGKYLLPVDDAAADFRKIDRVPEILGRRLQ